MCLWCDVLIWSLSLSEALCPEEAESALEATQFFTDDDTPQGTNTETRLFPEHQFKSTLKKCSRFNTSQAPQREILHFFLQNRKKSWLQWWAESIYETMKIYLSICVCLSSIRLSFYLSIIYPFIYPFIYLLFYRSIYLYHHLSVHLPFHLSVHLSIRSSVYLCLSVYKK